MNNYMPRLDNMGKMNNFLETYNLPKLNQEGKESLRRKVTSEIKTVIKKLPAHKTVDQMASQANFTKHLKKN